MIWMIYEKAANDWGKIAAIQMIYDGSFQWLWGKIVMIQMMYQKVSNDYEVRLLKKFPLTVI